MNPHYTKQEFFSFTNHFAIFSGGEWSDLHSGRFISGKNFLVPITQKERWEPKPVWTRWQREKSIT